MMGNNRNISTLEFFQILQLEFFLYELRIKIYPFAEDREKFKSIMEYKKKKIQDIAEKNKLDSIFNNKELRKNYENDFYEKLVGDELGSGRDKYFYYKIGSHFSYKGEPTIIKSYDFKTKKAIVLLKGDEQSVDFSEIKRIL